MMKKPLCAAALLLGLSGCSTMHFDNGSHVSTNATLNSWHHNAVFALVEVSEPVALDERCRGEEWSSVRNAEWVENHRQFLTTILPEGEH